jgi:hypothetical protein
MRAPFSQILDRVRYADLAAAKERFQSPELVQKTRALRASAGSGIHLAFCKIDAPAAAIITCYLDTDGTGEEVDVQCPCISPDGATLDQVIRRLKDGDTLLVVKINNEWNCLEGFQKIDSDQLQVDASAGLQTKLYVCP